MDSMIDLFVPGRVCLFGEHSDWAGAYRRFNSAIEPGQVIITGTNQGIYARVKACPGRLRLHTTLPDGRRLSEDLPLERERLLESARAGGFFSYAAGVAYTILTYYDVDGIEIDNHRTTLPVKKGLSSSAAFCVLVARAFNRVYDLKLTPRAEMEAAYQGEILTPSRCGRMDQGCAFGQVPVLMTFDGDLLQTARLSVGRHIPLLVADLKGHKDTVRILADLTRAYPFAVDDASRRVHEALGPLNAALVERAAAALRDGDAAGLGALMTEAQRLFDEVFMPLCPSELTAPRLHAVLADPRVRELSYGGKGVGSQGDGCAQLVARGDDERRQLAAYLEATWGMACHDLDLEPPRLVRKAIIPAAGFGTRMFPATKAVKKEMLPLVTPAGECKPILLAIVEEALEAGIEEIAIVVRAGDEPFYEHFFRDLPAPEHYRKLSEKARQACHDLAEIGRRITFIPQREQLGFGHAVYCARDWVGDEPFLLLLGDHIFASNTDRCCAGQLLDAFHAGGQCSVVAVYPAPAEEVCHYGTMAGTWLDDDQTLASVSDFVEKPSAELARQKLVTPGLPPDHFLCIYGQYVLTARIFEFLQRQIEADQRQAGEIQLTTALEALRRDDGMLAYVMNGEHYDTGLPVNYLRSIVSYYERGQHRGSP